MPCYSTSTILVLVFGVVRVQFTLFTMRHSCMTRVTEDYKSLIWLRKYHSLNEGPKYYGLNEELRIYI